MCLSTQKSGHLAIYRVEGLLITTVALISIKKCLSVHPIVAKAVPFAASPALFYLTTVHSAIFNTVVTRRGPGIYGLWICVHIDAYVNRNRSRPPLGYIYTSAAHSGFGPATAPSTKSAVLPGPSCKLGSTGYVSAI